MTLPESGSAPAGRATLMPRIGRARGRLVCLVGIDGAGKSTLARALAARTAEEGVNWHYRWGGFNSSFVLFKLPVALMKRTLFRDSRHVEDHRRKGRVLKSGRLSAIYQQLVLVDYFIATSLRIRVPLSFGTNVICDRYIYDLACSIGVLLEYNTERTMKLLNRWLRILPKPDLVFLIDLPEPVALGRKDDVVSLDFLAVRRRLYLEMARRLEMTVLDGTRDERELEETAAASILEHMRGED